MRGGAYLALRQAIGTLIAIVGVLLLSRILGPAQYGLYAAAAGIFAVAQLLTQLGINVYLIRSESEIDDRTRDSAATLLLALGIAGVIALVAAAPIIERMTRLSGFTPIGIALFASLPITQLSQVPLALLDRALDYKRMAQVELISQIVFPVVAVPLAIAQFGAFALVLGWWAQQVSLLLLLHGNAHYWPRFSWDSSKARDAVRFGLAFTASTWLYQLRRLVNPLIVGRYVGAEAVGIVAITAQIVTNLSFISVATWRLSTAALARVQGESIRLARAINEGMTLQVFAVAPFLVAFALVGRFFVPALMGPQWLPVMTVYPYLAVVTLLSGMFMLQSSALYVLRQNKAMALFHIAHTGILAVAALLLVPRFGLIGYGLAELATIGAFYVLHRQAERHVGGIRYFVLPQGTWKKIRDFTPAAFVAAMFK